MAEADQLTLDAPVAQRGFSRANAAGFGGDTSRSWRNEAGSSLLSALKDGAVEPGRRWPGVRAAQYRHLVTQHEDLDVLRRVGAGEERQPAQHASDHSGRRVRRPQPAIMLGCLWTVI